MQVTTELGGFTIAQYPDNVCTLILVICQNALEFRATGLCCEVTWPKWYNHHNHNHIAWLHFYLLEQK